MNVENLRIRRAIVHQFSDVKDTLTSVDQSLAESPHHLNDELRNELERKIVQLISSSSMSHEMIVMETGPNSVFSHLPQLIDPNDATFTESTKALARSLHQTHAGAALANSVLVVIDGRYGINQAPIVIVVKADKHQALTHTEAGRLSIVRDLFLGGSQRLNKIAAFGLVQPEETTIAESWEVRLFDGQTRGGADYFRTRFLGIASAPTGARFTELLSIGTMAYLDRSQLPHEEKARIARGIHTEIWESMHHSIDVETVASRYLPADHQDEYITHLHGMGLPTANFERDPTNLAKVKTFDLRFSNGIQLRLPWSGIDDNLSITESEEIDGTWTTIRFKGSRY